MASSSRGRQTFNLGIDLGTSAVKAVLAAADGSEVRTASAAWAARHSQPGWAEAGAPQWWRAVVRAVNALDKSGVEIAGIGLSVLYPALVLFDAAMRPLRPAILYCDQRAGEQSKKLLARYGERTARSLTGNAFPAGTASITSLLWLKEHERSTLRKTCRVGHAGTFLVHKLTGEYTIDLSDASLSGLYNTAANEWSAELCALAGITPPMLPQPMPAGNMAGRLSKRAAKQLGLAAGLPVAAGAGDTVCAALGMGVGDGQEMLLSCGSTNCFVRLSRKPDFDNGLVNCSFLDAGTWLNIGTTSSSGAAIQWFVDNYLTPGDYDSFFALCRRSAAGAGGMIFLPYLAGERTPHYDPHARAVFLGMSASSTLAHTARSVAEGVCFADRQILEVFERTGGPVSRIIAAGGGARNALMRRLRADVTGREIAFSSIANASAFGAALLGGLAAGTYRDWPQAAAVARRAGRLSLAKPRPEAHHSYEAAYSRYKELYPRVRDLFG
ncbi:MAG TPA: FGGY family carbohydrate kinase [Planctomycetota bacterium]|nr:FGGY family carbohydrate kinase [Planctomycetota bacterium]